MNNFLKILFLFLMLGANLNAQHVIVDSLETDSEFNEKEYSRPDTLFYFSNDLLAADKADSIRNLKGYDYLSDLDSLLKAKRKQDVSEARSAPTAFIRLINSDWFRMLIWILIIFAVIGCFYLFLNRNNLFRRKIRKEEISTEELHEEKPENFDTLLFHAKQKKDFRSAVKFLFLNTLYQLSEKQLIVFTPDKTNYQYIRELPVEFQKNFASLSLVFEYAWYGDQQLDESAYNEKEKMFIDFFNSISAF